MTIIQRTVRFTALLLLAATALFLATPSASASGFTDVSSSAWYCNVVDYVVGKGLFQGTSSTTFSPNANMTRAMFVTVLGRYANVDASSWMEGVVTGSDVNMRSGADTSYDVVATLRKDMTVTIRGRTGDWYEVSSGSVSGYMNAQYVSPKYLKFSDVGAGAYYAGYAAWAQENGIVTGVGEGRFAPGSNVTREQMCVMMARFAGVMGLSLSMSRSSAAFTDGGSISSWAKSSVDTMQRCGIVQGTDAGQFNPGSSATRAEAAAVLQRFDSACGGFAPGPQRPSDWGSGGDTAVPPEETDDDTTVPPEETGGDTTVPPEETDGDATVPPKETDDGTAEPPADPGSLPDTPAAYVGGTVGVQASVIRVGVLVKTQSIDTSVDCVTLECLNGTGFEYGAMSGRTFVSEGSVADTTVRITTDGAAFTLCDSVGNVVYTSAGNLAIHPSGGKTLTRVNGAYKYFGDFELSQASGKAGYMTVVNYVGIEDYVKGVLPFEFSNSWPAEAMKAAAIVCRSFAMSYDWSVYSSYGMDIVAGAGAQLYYGRSQTYDESYFSASDAAVDATMGQYLTYNGSVCVTSFSSCDGGRTLSAAEVFGTNHDYLIGKEDPYEQAAKGDIAAMGGNYDSMVSASHRVGMSAWGAYAMAKYYGKSCEAILGFYYTGTSIQSGG